MTEAQGTMIVSETGPRPMLRRLVAVMMAAGLLLPAGVGLVSASATGPQSSPAALRLAVVSLRPNPAPLFPPVVSLRSQPAPLLPPAVSLRPNPAPLLPPLVPNTIAPLTGSVTDLATGLPLAGATVAVDGQATLTDSRGRFQVAVPAGRYDVRVGRRDYGAATAVGVLVAASGTTVAVGLAPVNPSAAAAAAVAARLTAPGEAEVAPALAAAPSGAGGAGDRGAPDHSRAHARRPDRRHGHG